MSNRLAYSPDEVGELVGVNRKTVIGWIRDGVLPGRQIKGRWFVAAQDVQNLLGSGAGSRVENSEPSKTAAESVV